MLQKLKALFAPVAADDSGRDPLALAVAVLLAEAAAMDGAVDPEERAAIETALAGKFRLDHCAAAALFDKGLAQVHDGAELYSRARDIKNAFSATERAEVIEMLWEVVYADGRIHDYEANLMRRMARLLYVEDRDSAEARRRVRARMTS